MRVDFVCLVLVFTSNSALARPQREAKSDL